jgi:hypothetical protein
VKVGFTVREEKPEGGKAQEGFETMLDCRPLKATATKLRKDDIQTVAPLYEGSFDHA